jgi:hypothetical protein
MKNEAYEMSCLQNRKPGIGQVLQPVWQFDGGTVPGLWPG